MSETARELHGKENQARSAIWWHHFELLERFVEREGHAAVPREHLENGYQLGVWTAKQRWRRNRGDLSTEKIKALESLRGWVWRAKRGRRFGRRPQVGMNDTLVEVGAKTWEEAFGLLKAFVDKYGHAAVPRNYEVDDFRLGLWVTRQRRQLKLGTISQQRIALLDQLPGWLWDGRSRKRAEEVSRKLKRYTLNTGTGLSRAAQMAAPLPDRYLTDEARDKVYEQLLSLSNREFDEYEQPQEFDSFQLPGELAFFLDDLVEFADKKLKLDFSETLAEVIDYGITAWYTHLNPALLDELGLELPKLEEGVGVGGASTDPFATQREGDGNQGRMSRAALEQRVDELERRLRRKEELLSQAESEKTTQRLKNIEIIREKALVEQKIAELTDEKKQLQKALEDKEEQASAEAVQRSPYFQD